MTAQQPGGPGPEEGAEPGDRSRMAWLPWALVAVFAVAAIAMTWVAATLERDLDEAREGDSEVARTAGRFAEAFFTVDHRDLEAWRDAVLDLATGRFREEYEEAFEGGLDRLVAETRPVWEVTVEEVLVGDVDDGEANAVTVLDIDQDGTGGPRQIPNAYVRLALVRVDGEWRVSDVSYPQATDPLPLESPGGPSTTTTTAP